MPTKSWRAASCDFEFPVKQGLGSQGKMKEMFLWWIVLYVIEAFQGCGCWHDTQALLPPFDSLLLLFYPGGLS